jgi:ERCC4-type nuclease
MTHHELLIDFREKDLMEKLRFFKVPFKECNRMPADSMGRPIADVQYGPLTMERKTLEDLVLSVQDGRFETQTPRLALTDLPLVMVSGTISAIKDTYKMRKAEFNENVVYGTIASMFVRYGLSVIWVQEDWQLAKVLRSVIQKIDEGKLGQPHKLRSLLQSRDKRIDILKAMFGLTEAQAVGLLLKFKSLRQVFWVIENKEYQLTDVPGIADATVRKMKTVWLEEWK